MADSSWDNSGLPVERKGMGTGMKVALGCGIAALLLFVTCVAGGALLGRYVKKDPEGFERKMEAWAQGLVQEDWDRVRSVVDRLQTEEGARGLYRENPRLAGRHPTETAFLAEVQAWRPHLKPLAPDALAREDRALGINKSFGTTRIRYTYPDGTRLGVTLENGALAALEVTAP